jgi:hypothetical protein
MTQSDAILVEAIWLRLREVLSGFAGEITVVVNEALAYEVVRTANDAFLLRGYAAFRRRSGGGELAITVDVQRNDQHLSFESDVCTDDGTIVAVGPSAAIPISESQSSVEASINSWMRDFECFLSESKPAVVTAASRLDPPADAGDPSEEEPGNNH